MKVAGRWPNIEVFGCWFTFSPFTIQRENETLLTSGGRVPDGFWILNLGRFNSYFCRRFVTANWDCKYGVAVYRRPKWDIAFGGQVGVG